MWASGAKDLETEVVRGRQSLRARGAASQGRTLVIKGNQGWIGPQKEALGQIGGRGCAGWVETSGSAGPCLIGRKGDANDGNGIGAAVPSTLPQTQTSPDWGRKLSIYTSVRDLSGHGEHVQTG